MLNFVNMPEETKSPGSPAYMDGYIACMYSSPIIDCPFADNTTAALAWQRGWRAANRVAERKDKDPEYASGLYDGTSGYEARIVSFAYTTGWNDGDYARKLWRNFSGSDI
jgi:hypothetical protein